MWGVGSKNVTTMRGFCFSIIWGKQILFVISPPSSALPNVDGMVSQLWGYNLLFIKVSHCIKSVRIRSYSGLYFSCIFPHSDWIQRETEYLSVFSPKAEKCGKNADQINSETDTFYTVFVMHGHVLRTCIVVHNI